MLACERFRPFVNRLPGILKGMTPHVVWHFAAGYASYCGISCLLCCRLEELRIPYKVKYHFGVLPNVVRCDQ